jgi:hypothetical protein
MRVISIIIGIISILVQIQTSSKELNWSTFAQIIGGALAWVASLAFVGYIWDKVKSDL